MDLQLESRAALATGASRGIGRAIALGLARGGVKPAVAARRVNLLEGLAREAVYYRHRDAGRRRNEPLRL